MSDNKLRAAAEKLVGKCSERPYAINWRCKSCRYQELCAALVSLREATPAAKEGGEDCECGHSWNVHICDSGCQAYRCECKLGQKHME
jgi:hypothetical protein